MLYLLHSNLVYDTIIIIQITVLQIISILFISFNTLFQSILIKQYIIIIFFKIIEVLYYITNEIEICFCKIKRRLSPKMFAIYLSIF